MAFPFQKMWHFSDKTVKLDSGCKLPGFSAANSTSSYFLERLSNVAQSFFSESDVSERPHPPSHGPQDVIYGLTQGYNGITGDTSKWGDPAIAKFQQAFWLRTFVHYFGDIHQPLHCANGCSSAHPEGDRGGNLFKIKTEIVNDFEGTISASQSNSFIQIFKQVLFFYFSRTPHEGFRAPSALGLGRRHLRQGSQLAFECHWAGFRDVRGQADHIHFSRGRGAETRDPTGHSSHRVYYRRGQGISPRP